MAHPQNMLAIIGDAHLFPCNSLLENAIRGVAARFPSMRRTVSTPTSPKFARLASHGCEQAASSGFFNGLVKAVRCVTPQKDIPEKDGTWRTSAKSGTTRPERLSEEASWWPPDKPNHPLPYVKKRVFVKNKYSPSSFAMTIFFVDTMQHGCIMMPASVR
ncbi:MAG: hypothetical protein ACLFOY_09265 [Desulfatibacillaceae bacterium]